MEPAVLFEGYKSLLNDAVKRLLVVLSLMCLSADAPVRDSAVLEFEYRLPVWHAKYDLIDCVPWSEQKSYTQGPMDN